MTLWCRSVSSRAA